jgi:hypothetical protein
MFRTVIEITVQSSFYRDQYQIVMIDYTKWQVSCSVTFPLFICFLFQISNDPGQSEREVTSAQTQYHSVIYDTTVKHPMIQVLRLVNQKPIR